MNALELVKKNLRPGTVYRRSDLAAWSNAVDRHLETLQSESVLKKLSGGLYYYPKKTTFGEAPPSEDKLVEKFLNDSRFLILSPDVYNSLKVGTTQLYSETVVYNHKRHGIFKLGKQTFRFVKKDFFPKKLSESFLLVDLVNNSSRLVEDREKILKLVIKRAKQKNPARMKTVVTKYAGVRARKFFSDHFQESLNKNVH